LLVVVGCWLLFMRLLLLVLQLLWLFLWEAHTTQRVLYSTGPTLSSPRIIRKVGACGSEDSIGPAAPFAAGRCDTEGAANEGFIAGRAGSLIIRGAGRTQRTGANPAATTNGMGAARQTLRALLRYVAAARKRTAIMGPKRARVEESPAGMALRTADGSSLKRRHHFRQSCGIADLYTHRAQ
jgi:hypothetical protein